MKIVADSAIPFIEQYFATLGEVVRLPGPAIDAAGVRDAEVLIVRTATRVDRDLLAGSRIRVVATATSGVDHIDTDYLVDSGVGLVSAAGCNARAVAEYVLSSLCVLAGRRGLDLHSLRAGIIGRGHVGQALLGLLQACGVQCRVCDPPLQEAGEEGVFYGLEATLQADIISLHVPLTRSGRHATQDLVNDEFLDQLAPEVILVNASRGGVMDEGGLLRFLRSRPDVDCVLDVWRNEPAINMPLLQACRIGTPHIAGYTVEAKRRATRMVFDRICESLGLEKPGVDDPGLPLNHMHSIHLPDHRQRQEVISMAVLASYDVRRDHNLLQPIQDVAGGQRAAWFENLRRQYPLRREFISTRIEPLPASIEQQGILRDLGFRLAGEAAGP